jgi:hypothetical protein
MRLAGKPRFWFLVSGFWLACPAFGQPTIEDTIRRLQQFRDPEPPVVEMRVSPEIATLHRQLKHELRDFIIDALNRGADVQAELTHAGVHIASKEGNRPYGQLHNVIVDWKPNGLSAWVAFTTTLGVKCGEDSSLYLLQRAGDAWQLRLAMESNMRLGIDSAHGYFQYAVSRAGPGGHFFVVGANVNPWCSSNWQQLRFEAFTMDASGTPSKVLSKSSDIFLGDYPPPYKLTVQRHVFTLEINGGGPSGESRTHVISYSVEGNSAKRVAPIVLKP